MLFDASGAMVPNPAFLETAHATLTNKNEPLLFGCKAGGRSAKAIGMLPEYTDTTNVTGGFGAWLAQGLPTEK